MRSARCCDGLAIFRTAPAKSGARQRAALLDCMPLCRRDTPLDRDVSSRLAAVPSVAGPLPARTARPQNLGALGPRSRNRPVDLRCHGSVISE
jgi:hypothetical protein